MRRRDFLAALGSVGTLPFAARAQERVRHVGALITAAIEDPEGQLRFAAFQQRLQALGWTVGRNLRIDHRSAMTGNTERTRQAATELLALSPDVLVVAGGGVQQLQRLNRSVPIVFFAAID